VAGQKSLSLYLGSTLHRFELQAVAPKAKGFEVKISGISFPFSLLRACLNLLCFPSLENSHLEIFTSTTGQQIDKGKAVFTFAHPFSASLGTYTLGL